MFSNTLCGRGGFSKRRLFRKAEDEALKLEDEAPCFLRMRLPDFLRNVEDEAPSFLRMRLPDFLRNAEDEAPSFLRMRLPDFLRNAEDEAPSFLRMRLPAFFKDEALWFGLNYSWCQLPDLWFLTIKLTINEIKSIQVNMLFQIPALC